jgi:hypothetical protein
MPKSLLRIGLIPRRKTGFYSCNPLWFVPILTAMFSNWGLNKVSMILKFSSNKWAVLFFGLPRIENGN